MREEIGKPIFPNNNNNQNQNDAPPINMNTH